MAPLGKVTLDRSLGSGSYLQRLKYQIDYANNLKSQLSHLRYQMGEPSVILKSNEYEPKTGIAKLRKEINDWCGDVLDN